MRDGSLNLFRVCGMFELMDFSEIQLFSHTSLLIAPSDKAFNSKTRIMVIMIITTANFP